MPPKTKNQSAVEGVDSFPVKIICRKNNGTYSTLWSNGIRITDEPEANLVGTGLLDVYHINKDAEKKLKSKNVNEKYYIVELKHKFGSGTHGSVIVDFDALADLEKCDWDYYPRNDSNNNDPIADNRITIDLPMADRDGFEASVDCEVVRVISTAAVLPEMNDVIEQSNIKPPAVPPNATPTELTAWVRDSRDPMAESYNARILTPYSGPDQDYVNIEWDGSYRTSVHKDQIVPGTIRNINDNSRSMRSRRAPAPVQVKSNGSIYEQPTIEPSTTTSPPAASKNSLDSPVPETILSNSSTAFRDDDESTIGGSMSGDIDITGPLINTPFRSR